MAQALQHAPVSLDETRQNRARTRLAAKHEHSFDLIDLLPLALANGHRRLAEKLRRFEALTCECGTQQVVVVPGKRLARAQESRLLTVGLRLLEKA